MNVAIRADGGPSIGFGHLVRSGAVAAECLRNGDSVVYLTATPDAVSTLLPESIAVEPLDATDDPEEVLRALDDRDIDSLFLDLFEADTEYQRTIAEGDVRTVVRHNYQNHTVCCDALVYGDIHAPDLEYNWVGSKPDLLLGPDYILLRKQFREIAQREPRWRSEPNRALVTMGGSDVNGATPDVMRAFSEFDGTVDVIIGPGFSNADEIEKTASALDVEFRLLYDPENMADLMYSADIAVSAVGGTVFELLATRTPFVGIPQAENQTQRAEALRRRGLSRIVLDEKSIAAEVEILAEANGKRRELFGRMEGVIDGKGAQRVRENLNQQ